jgi:hypothetical protein
MPKISEGAVALTGLFALAIWLFVALPYLYGPAPLVHKHEPQSSEAAKPTSTEPKGTAAAPFFVQVIPTPKPAEERAQDAEDREEKKDADRWLVRWTFALFAATIGLILATGVLGYFAHRQARDMKESVAVAAKSAEAAMLSTRAAIALQLPVFRITPDKLGWGDTKTGENTIRAYCHVNAVRFRNVGQTRAYPIEIRYGYTLGGPLPLVPSYQFAERFLPENVFGPDPQSASEKRLNGDIEMQPEDWPLINTGAKDLWFYCEFTFEDFMDIRHDVSFCWKWAYVGSGMAWRRDRTPAYNRKT